MGRQEIIDHLKTIIDLESMLYVNQKLCDKMASKIDQERNSKPTSPAYGNKNSINVPSDGSSSVILGTGVFSIIMGVVFVIYFFANIADFALGDGGSGFFLFFLMIVLFGVGYWLVKLELGSRQEYKNNLEQYHRQLENIDQNNQKLKEQYEKALREYNAEDNIRQSHIDEYNDMLALSCRIADTLEKEYSKGIVFPKYHSIVAITMFYEYLVTGRCETLDGINGCYNLYESEVRQNLIISNLSALNGSIDDLRDRQYVLYSNLSSANLRIEALGKDILNKAAITAYYSEVSAKIAAETMFLIGTSF